MDETVKSPEATTAQPITNSIEFYRACLDHTDNGDVYEAGVGRYTEVHVSNGEVIVAPSPLDQRKHWAKALGGTHSLFDALDDPQTFKDIPGIADFASQHHLGMDTYVGRAGLVTGDQGETILRLYELSYEYENDKGHRVRDLDWLEKLMEISKELGIDRVEQKTYGDAPPYTLGGTEYRPHLSYEGQVQELSDRPLPLGTRVGIATGATLDGGWKSIRYIGSVDGIAQRQVSSSVTLAQAIDVKHGGLYEKIGRKPDEEIMLTWNGKALGFRGTFEAETRADQPNFAKVSIMLSSKDSMDNLMPAAAALGMPLIEAARRASGRYSIQRRTRHRAARYP